MTKGSVRMPHASLPYPAMVYFGNPRLDRRKEVCDGTARAVQKKAISFDSSPFRFPSDYWEHILGSLEEGILVIDQEQRIIFVNSAAEQITSLPYTQVWYRP